MPLIGFECVYTSVRYLGNVLFEEFCFCYQLQFRRYSLCHSELSWIQRKGEISDD